MKKFHAIILATLLSIFSSSCSNNQSNKTEIRFVDLQGNPRPIKTRVPEANAKIMSGQISHEQMSKAIEKEYNVNQRVVAESNLGQRKGAFSSPIYDNSPVPKFTDEDVYRKNTPRLLVDTNAPSEPENPLIEYDLKEDSYAKDKNLTKETSNKQVKNIFTENSNKVQEVANNTENSNNIKQGSQSSSTSKVTSRTKKIITYSSSDNEKNSNVDSSENNVSTNNISSNEESTSYEEESTSSGIEIIDETNTKLYAKYGKKGKFYVQVGAYLNSKGAKDKIKSVKGFGGGKVFIGYKNNSRIYRSVYGPYKTRAQADNVKNRINKSGLDAIVIRGK